MITYRATLHATSATRSPWQADTLFGHLCWIIRYEEGERALREFLSHYREGTPPLVLSNGFPQGRFPRPIVPAPDVPAARAKQAQVQAMRQAKAGKGIRWISLEEFNAFRRGEMVTLHPRNEVVRRRTVLKNQINRLSGGTTPVDEDEGGNLYNADELAFVDTSGVESKPLGVTVYVKAENETWADRAFHLIRRLSWSGYGAKKSVGYGQFTFSESDWERFRIFERVPDGANGFISLSNWVPARRDPTDGFYNTMVKYGKLGEELANSENPFKFPLTMLTAGSSFYVEPPIQDWYGRLVADIAPAAPEVVQFGYAFAVPARLAAEKRS